MRNSLEIKDEKAQLKTRAAEMIDLCKKEIRDFNPEEQKEFDEIRSKIEGLNTELQALEDSLEIKDDSQEEEESRKTQNFINTTMEKRFSLVKAIRNVANNKPQDELTAAVLAAGSEEVRRSGISAQ
jgi:predicted nuclease with TOPRIM domain